MKTSVLLGCTLATLLSTTIASAATKEYRAVLSGAQVVPPVTTPANVGGSATLTFDDVSKNLYGFVAWQGIAPNAYHIHNGGACGVDGAGVLAGLPAPSGTVITIPAAGAGAITLDAAGEAELVAGTLYINLHSTDHPNGHLRGQIYPVVDGGIMSCPATTADAGTDSGTTSSSSSSSSGASSSGSSSGASSSGGSSSSSSSGASTERPDAGSPTSPAGGGDGDGGGCATTGESSTGHGALVALGLGIAVAGVMRARRRRA